MALYVNTWVERYPRTMDFLLRDFVTLTKGNAGIWDAFTRTANLESDTASRLITFTNADEPPPLLWFADLGDAIDGQFQHEHPDRFLISIEVAKHFELDSGNPDARTFLQGRVLHEMVHWSLFNQGTEETREMGYEFESLAYPGKAPLRHFWNGAASPRTIQTPASALVPIDHGSAEAAGLPEFGNAQLGQELPRGIRNNNPGNIKRSGESWEGLANPGDMTDYQRRETVFCVFSEPVWGLRAMGRVLLNYQTKHRLTTVAAMIGRWAPPDDDNKTKAYVSFVAQRMNIGEGEVFDFRNPDRGPLMMSAIVRQENGIQPYSADQIVLAHEKAVA